LIVPAGQFQTVSRTRPECRAFSASTHQLDDPDHRDFSVRPSSLIAIQINLQGARRLVDRAIAQ
jgi:hypothetical protein